MNFTPIVYKVMIISVWLLILFFIFLKLIGRPASEKTVRVGRIWKISQIVHIDGIKYIFIAGTFHNKQLRVVKLETETMIDSIDSPGTYAVNLNLKGQKIAVKIGETDLYQR
jgi:hypothetical protein